MNDMPSFARSVAAPNDDQDRTEGIGGTNALEFLQAIYRSGNVPLSVRMRAAIEALQFESPKLSATATLTSEDFAQRLERAIARSGAGARLIEHREQEQ